MTLEIDEMQRIKDQFNVLSKRYSWEIIASIYRGAKFITQIARENDIPYTTAQHRVTEMERVGLVTLRGGMDDATGRAVKRVRLTNFRIILDPKRVYELMEARKGPTITM